MCALFKKGFVILVHGVILFNCVLNKTPKKNMDSAILLLPLLQVGTTSNVSILLEDVADNVISAPNHTGEGYYEKSRAINGVRGGGCCSGSTDVFSLSQTGIGASIVLEWKSKKVTNGSGIDFIVFENPFNINGNSSMVFMDPIIVEVSQDNMNYCGFQPDYIASNENDYSNDPANWQNFAGKKPVLYNEETNKLNGSDLYNLTKSGGDGFDLDNLSSSDSFGIGCTASLASNIKSNGFLYIRLTSATERTNPDSGLKFPKDSAAIDGSDIDGVFARYRSSR